MTLLHVDYYKLQYHIQYTQGCKPDLTVKYAVQQKYYMHQYSSSERKMVPTWYYTTGMFYEIPTVK